MSKRYLFGLLLIAAIGSLGSTTESGCSPEGEWLFTEMTLQMLDACDIAVVLTADPQEPEVYQNVTATASLDIACDHIVYISWFVDSVFYKEERCYSGQSTFSTSFTTVGPHTISVSVEAEDTYADKQNASVTVQVKETEVTPTTPDVHECPYVTFHVNTSAESNGNYVGVGEDLVLIATLFNGPSDNYSYHWLIDGNPVGTTNMETYTTQIATAGAHTITLQVYLFCNGTDMLLDQISTIVGVLAR